MLTRPLRPIHRPSSAQPQRDERLGWTGDSALTSEECALNYDVAAFLSHWADTIDDSLTRNAADPTFKEGGLPETIPDVTGGYDADASWSSVYPTTLHTLWKAYGDAAPAARYWPGLMAFVNHTVSGMKGGNITGIFHTWGGAFAAASVRVGTGGVRQRRP